MVFDLLNDLKNKRKILYFSCRFIAEPNPEFDHYLYSPATTTIPHASTGTSGTPTSSATTILPVVNSAHAALTTNSNNTTASATPNASEISNDTITAIATNEDTTMTGQMIHTSQVIKGLIYFLSQESSQPMWNYEDITAKGEHQLAFENFGRN